MTKLIFNNNFKEWPQVLAIFSASLGMVNFGLLYAWSSPTIAKIIDKDYPLQITYEQASYLTVLPSISTIIVAIPISLLLDGKGSKYTLLFATIPYFFAWLLIAISNSIWCFYASRLISGIADACEIGATSVYVGEVTVPVIRGKWGNLLILGLYSGILLAYAVGGYFNISTTAYVFLGVPVINFILLCYVPESPYFLIIKGKNEEAKKALEWFCQEQNVETEFKIITDVVSKQTMESGTYKEIFTIRSNRRALTAVLFLRLCQQFSGVSAFIVYSETIFKMAGNYISATTSALICGLIQLVFSAVGAIVVEKFGRRIAFVTSAIGCIIILLFMTIYFYIGENTSIDVSSIFWFPLFGMISFLIIFSLGLSVVPTLISGELFSSSVKGKSMAIHNIVFAACIAGTTKIFHVLSEFGLFAPFLFYTITCFVFAIICYFVTPETKGKTLDEIQHVLRS